jgi:hypothetical protein
MLRAEKMEIYRNAPEWVLAGEMSNPVNGTGKAEVDGDDQAAFKDAYGNAEISLHERLDNRIRVCLSEFFRNDRDLVEEAFARIVENISATAKSGMKQQGFWKSPDNAIFVLVVSDVDAIREALKKNLVGFLEARKHDSFDISDKKVQEKLEKCCMKYFRHFQKLQESADEETVIK